MATLREEVSSRIAENRRKIEELKVARQEVEMRAIQSMASIDGRILEIEQAIVQFDLFLAKLPVEVREESPAPLENVTADVASSTPS